MDPRLPTHAPDALRRVIDRSAALASRGRLPVVVFDLDSTIFSTRPRNLRIVREFAMGRADAALDAVVARLVPDDFGWDVAAPLVRAGWESPDGVAALRQFWFDRFFTDEYVLTDTPHPGAVEYVNRVHAAGALVYYLTGRHVGGMEAGTARALTQHGFPLWRGRTALHLKPDFHLADKAYKDAALADIRSHHGDVVATFENEPGNANLFLRSFPDADHFLVLTEHSPEAEAPHPGLIQVPDFRA